MKTLTRVLYLGPEIIVEDFLASPLHRSIIESPNFPHKERAFKWTLRDPLHPIGVDRPHRKGALLTARWRDRRRHGATEPCPGSPRFLFPLSNLTHAGHHSTAQRALASLFCLHRQVVFLPLGCIEQCRHGDKRKFFTYHHHHNNPKTETFCHSWLY